MHDDELREKLFGKRIVGVEFNTGISGHCNFIKSLTFDDGSRLILVIKAKSDFAWRQTNHLIPTITENYTVMGTLKEIE